MSRKPTVPDRKAPTATSLAAFLAGGAGFLEIAELVERALDAVPAEPLSSLEQVLEADARARAVVADATRTAA